MGSYWPKPKRQPMPRMVELVCPICGSKYKTRAVELSRGWGKACSRSCAAQLRENEKKEKARAEG